MLFASRLPRGAGKSLFRRHGLVWFHAVLLSPSPAPRAAAESDDQFYCLQKLAKPIAVARSRANGALALAEIRVEQAGHLFVISHDRASRITGTSKRQNGGLHVGRSELPLPSPPCSAPAWPPLLYSVALIAILTLIGRIAEGEYLSSPEVAWMQCTHTCNCDSAIIVSRHHDAASGRIPLS